MNTAQQTDNAPLPGRRRKAARPVMLRLSDVRGKPVGWLWPNRIPLGKLTLLAGDPGLGKSLVTLDLAARVSRGAAWPDAAAGATVQGSAKTAEASAPSGETLRTQGGFFPAAPAPEPHSATASVAPTGSVILLNAEDDLEDTVLPRLRVAGANLQRITALSAAHDDGPTRPLELAHDLPALETALAAHRDCRLLVIDPISAYLGNGDGNSNADVRRLLFPLGELAQRHGIAVVAVTHLNKKVQSRAIYRAMGSLAFVAAARAAWGVVRDPQDDGRCLFLPLKCNVAPQTKGLAYRLETSEEAGAPAVVWDERPVEANLDERLQASDARPEEFDACIVWLRDMLQAHAMPRQDLLLELRYTPFSLTQLYRAADKLGVVKIKEGWSHNSWIWQLPGAEDEGTGP